MKRLFLILATLCTVLISSAQEMITLSRFEGKKITGIRADAGYVVTVRQGSNTGAKLSLPSRYADKVRFDLGVDGILVLGFTDGSNFTNASFIADVTCSSLNYVGLSGIANLTVEGAIESPSFSLNMAGAAYFKAGDIVVNGDADIRFSGAANSNISKISAGTFMLGISGAPNFSSSIVANDVRISASGAPILRLNVDLQTDLTLKLSGAPKIELVGRVPSAAISVSGSPKINCEHLTVKTMNLIASGGASLIVNASDELNVSASGSTSIRYKGSPRISLKSSGAASIKAY